MRTTLDIEDDVLEAAKERARREHKTTGRLISDLLRRALTAPEAPTVVREVQAIYGLRPFPSRGGVVTNALVNRLREEEGI
jgi:hypothetical protein